MDESDAFVKEIITACESIGLDVCIKASGGGSDANKLNYMGIPSVDALGPYMYEIHSTNEHMSIASIERRTRLFCLVLGIMDDYKLK